MDFWCPEIFNLSLLTSLLNILDWCRPKAEYFTQRKKNLFSYYRKQIFQSLTSIFCSLEYFHIIFKIIFEINGKLKIPFWKSLDWPDRMTLQLQFIVNTPATTWLASPSLNSISIYWIVDDLMVPEFITEFIGVLWNGKVDPFKDLRICFWWYLDCKNFFRDPMISNEIARLTENSPLT